MQIEKLLSPKEKKRLCYALQSYHLLEIRLIGFSVPSVDFSHPLRLLLISSTHCVFSDSWSPPPTNTIPSNPNPSPFSLSSNGSVAAVAHRLQTEKQRSCSPCALQRPSPRIKRWKSIMVSDTVHLIFTYDLLIYLIPPTSMWWQLGYRDHTICWCGVSSWLEHEVFYVLGCLLQTLLLIGLVMGSFLQVGRNYDRCLCSRTIWSSRWEIHI